MRSLTPSHHPPDAGPHSAVWEMPTFTNAQSSAPGAESYKEHSIDQTMMTLSSGMQPLALSPRQRRFFCRSFNIDIYLHFASLHFSRFTSRLREPDAALCKKEVASYHKWDLNMSTIASHRYKADNIWKRRGYSVRPSCAV